MTDKVDQWIWYCDKTYKRIKKLKLISFINKVNDNPYYHRKPARFFATYKMAKEYLIKYNKGLTY